MMLRVGSFLMIVLLGAPMVQACCLPAAQVLPCHGARQSEDQACVSNQQFVVQVKSYDAASFSNVWFPLVKFFLPVTDAFDQVVRPYTYGTDIYLRTGALLI